MSGHTLATRARETQTQEIIKHLPHQSNYANPHKNFSNKRQDSFVFLLKHLKFTAEKTLSIPPVQGATPFHSANVRALSPPFV